MDNNSIIMFAIVFIFIIYQQMQINKLTIDNQENFADTNTVTTENLNAITNLGNLASDILSKGALNVAGDLKVNGITNLFRQSIEDDTGNALTIGTIGNNADINGSKYINRWMLNTYAGPPPLTGPNITTTSLHFSALKANGTTTPSDLWNGSVVSIDMSGNMIITGNLTVKGNIRVENDTKTPTATSGSIYATNEIRGANVFAAGNIFNSGGMMKSAP